MFSGTLSLRSNPIHVVTLRATKSNLSKPYCFDIDIDKNLWFYIYIRTSGIIKCYVSIFHFKIEKYIMILSLKWVTCKQHLSYYLNAKWLRHFRDPLSLLLLDESTNLNRNKRNFARKIKLIFRTHFVWKNSIESLYLTRIIENSMLAVRDWNALEKMEDPILGH